MGWNDYAFSSILLIGRITLLAFHVRDQTRSPGIKPLITGFVSGGGGHKVPTVHGNSTSLPSHCSGGQRSEIRCGQGHVLSEASWAGPFLSFSSLAVPTHPWRSLVHHFHGHLMVLALCVCLPETFSPPPVFCCSYKDTRHMGPRAHANPGWPRHHLIASAETLFPKMGTCTGGWGESFSVCFWGHNSTHQKLHTLPFLCISGFGLLMLCWESLHLCSWERLFCNFTVLQGVVWISYEYTASLRKRVGEKPSSVRFLIRFVHG